jgi:hypothetical protein
MKELNSGTLVARSVKIASCIAFMYAFSISLTFYNKWMMKVSSDFINKINVNQSFSRCRAILNNFTDTCSNIYGSIIKITGWLLHDL